MATLLKNEATKIIRPWFDPDEDTLEQQFNLLNNMYFLIKQGDTFGERLKCLKCGGRHNYITLNCIERPFTGLTRGLYAYCQAIQDHKLVSFMSPEERARYDTVTDVLNNMPDIGTVHPSLARKMSEDLGPTDMKIGALALGILEGIARVHAQELVKKINDKGLRPKLVLELPNPMDRYRMERRRALQVHR